MLILLIFVEKFQNFGAHYTYHYYWHFERDYKCTIGKDNDSDDMILYRNRENIFNEKYCLSENDCMTVCIDSNNCLHFVHSKPLKMKMKMEMKMESDANKNQQV